MKNKKSSVTVNMLIVLALGAFVFLVLANIVPNLLKKGSGETSAYFDDHDNDGIADSLDKCACDPGEEENNGCPATGEFKDGYDADKRESCKNEMKGASV